MRYSIEVTAQITGVIGSRIQIFIEGLKVIPQCVELWVARIELYQKEGKQTREENDDDKENETTNYPTNLECNFYAERDLRTVFELGLDKVRRAKNKAISTANWQRFWLLDWRWMVICGILEIVHSVRNQEWELGQGNYWNWVTVQITGNYSK